MKTYDKHLDEAATTENMWKYLESEHKYNFCLELLGLEDNKLNERMVNDLEKRFSILLDEVWEETE